MSQRTDDQKLARSRNGVTVHRASCRYARVPWKWADDKTDEEAYGVVLQFGYTDCAVCKPFAGLVSD